MPRTSGPTARPPAQNGGFLQIIGTSRGGCTTKLYGLADEQGRPRVRPPSAGNVNDMTMAASLINAAGPFTRLIADRGYDTNAIRSLDDPKGQVNALKILILMSLILIPHYRIAADNGDSEVGSLEEIVLRTLIQFKSARENGQQEENTSLRYSRPYPRVVQMHTKLWEPICSVEHLMAACEVEMHRANISKDAGRCRLLARNVGDDLSRTLLLGVAKRLEQQARNSSKTGT